MNAPRWHLHLPVHTANAFLIRSTHSLPCPKAFNQPLQNRRSALCLTYLDVELRLESDKTPESLSLSPVVGYSRPPPKQKIISARPSQKGRNLTSIFLAPFWRPLPLSHVARSPPPVLVETSPSFRPRTFPLTPTFEPLASQM